MNKAKKEILQRQQVWGNDSKVLVKRMKPPKQAGMVATRLIKKGQTIAYYPIVLIADPGLQTTDPLRNYFIEVRYQGRQNSLVGKPDLAMVARSPTRGIPYTALWANEPYPMQVPNAEMVGHELTRKPAVGDKIKYSLKATKTIHEGEEVMWCYGTEFDRGSPPYKTGCSY